MVLNVSCKIPRLSQFLLVTVATGDAGLPAARSSRDGVIGVQKLEVALAAPLDNLDSLALISRDLFSKFLCHFIIACK